MSQTKLIFKNELPKLIFRDGTKILVFKDEVKKVIFNTDNILQDSNSLNLLYSDGNTLKSV